MQFQARGTTVQVMSNTRQIFGNATVKAAQSVSSLMSSACYGLLQGLTKTYLALKTTGMKEGSALFKRRTQHILFTVIWRRTYGKGPLR